MISSGGVEGDRQADRRAHGGPRRAVCLYPLELIEALAAEGHDVAPGHFGENITTRGLDWDLVLPGVRLRLGAEVLIEITEYTTPCWKQSQWFTDGDFNRLSAGAHPGQARVYAKVIEGGTVETGSKIELIEVSLDERLERQRIPAIRWTPS
ncbi:MAG: MOSC domain-containing protein [Chloroflexi bacterium]|nr:MOSC domain-containing protein [Chloroflexota bacterium]MDA1002562.1 MOSC domain-containing protein [Chloroflexota bacterium]